MTSLLRHTDIPMRQNIDKELGALDLDQLFDQYVETDLLQLTDPTADPSSSDDLAHLFELPPSNGDEAFETSPMPDWDACTEHAWHKALQKLEQNPASPTTPDNSFSIYPESRGKAALSDPEFFILDDLFALDKVEPRALSQPSTPRPQVARPAKQAGPSPDRSIRHGIHKAVTRKAAISNIAAKMMRQSHYRPGFQDLWTRKMDAAPEAFTLQMPSHDVQSPPASTRFTQDDNSCGFFPRQQQPYTIAMSDDPTTTPETQHSNYQLTPLSSPAIDASSSRNANGSHFQFSNDHMASAYISHQAALSALQTPPPSHRLPMTTWGSEPSPNLDFSSFSASPDFSQSQDSKTAAGWSWSGNGPPTVPMTQTQPHGSHSRSSSQNMSFSTASVAGLGISCDTASFGSFGPELSAGSNGLNTSASFDMASYNTMYPPPTTSGIPIGHGPANPPSRSPSLSPQPRFTRRRHSSHNNAHHHHTSSRSRRKSSNSSNQSGGRSGSGSNPGVGFVNFTPDDSRKILTGVAPSGSSKTKARREKEAAEKRRKLSQAAMKAVMEAGGDVGRLEREGLLVLEG
ncbi:hypothetical protein BU26DRAFT_519544 [Trematosphaeria pertusa]|uniref:Developmental regulatory protein wetA n=1 Tax=Trematosphaeria pertusa TaxID=390896 RepID=A0A6A6IFZ4_9PLEO|nr:uncharacterized protein BU26DRAFT_519544 [Trematosphaeria pertusa]KAF2249495.1 hypothetical protein BU26DRAFT_519544 [Trematosphaeria pertusa]